MKKASRSIFTGENGLNKLRLDDLWKKSREYIHVIAAFVASYEGVVSVLHFVSEEFPESSVGKIVNDYASFIVYSNVIINLAMGIAIVMIVRRYSRVRQQLKEKKNELFRCRTPESKFRSIARRNSECDARLFDVLFHDGIPPIPSKALQQRLITVCGSAEFYVNKNILDLLNSVKEIFDGLNGYKCAVCVKVLTNRNKAMALADMTVEVLARNEDSKSRKDKPKQIYTISRNTALLNTIGTGKMDSFFRNNNLSEYRSYSNENIDWKSLYNATIVVPIPDLDEKASTSVRGVLCVDSMIGNFDEDLNLHYLQEFAWRFGVMLYRIEGLGRIGLNV